MKLYPRRKPSSRPATNVPLLGKSAVRKSTVRFQILAALELVNPVFKGLLTEMASSPAAFDTTDS